LSRADGDGVHEVKTTRRAGRARGRHCEPRHRAWQVPAWPSCRATPADSQNKMVTNGNGHECETPHVSAGAIFVVLPTGRQSPVSLTPLLVIGATMRVSVRAYSIGGTSSVRLTPETGGNHHLSPVNRSIRQRDAWSNNAQHGQPGRATRVHKLQANHTNRSTGWAS